MIKLRGINVYPTAVGVHLSAHPAPTGEFVCCVERRGVRDELTVVVEVRAGAERVAISTRSSRRSSARSSASRSDVELVAPGATAPLTGIEARQKPIRLIDRRQR